MERGGKTAKQPNKEENTFTNGKVVHNDIDDYIFPLKVFTEKKLKTFYGVDYLFYGCN